MEVIIILGTIKWLFFDVGSTLVDEKRMGNVAKTANVTYEYVYETALELYRQNKKGRFGDYKIIKC